MCCSWYYTDILGLLYARCKCWVLSVAHFDCTLKKFFLVILQVFVVRSMQSSGCVNKNSPLELGINFMWETIKIASEYFCFDPEVLNWGLPHLVPAYKSLSRISRLLKIEFVCGPKSLTRIKVAGGFWGLVLDVSFAQQRPIIHIVCMSRHLQRRRDEWPTSRPLDVQWGRKAVASTCPLMRNWDHGTSKLQWTTGRRWESGISEKKCVTSLLQETHLSVMTGQAVVLIRYLNRVVHQWTDRCEPVVTWRYSRLQRC